MAISPQHAATLMARQMRFNTRIEWYIRQFMRGYNTSMSARVRLGAQLLRDQIVINLSVPVHKIRTSRGTRVDRTSRSKPGEFPRADTTRLMKDIFFEMRSTGFNPRAIVGTTLDYGLILEIAGGRRGRPFLVRTLRQFEPQLRRILTQGRGGSTRMP